MEEKEEGNNNRNQEEDDEMSQWVDKLSQSSEGIWTQSMIPDVTALSGQTWLTEF